MQNSINGILIVDKPTELTSRDVVNRVSKILKTKKIGHTGTLDPMATGVLVLTIGKCTKLTDYLTSTYKEYIATFILGYETDTLDTTGKKKKNSTKIVTKREIIDVINSYQKEYLQEVPLYSAVKIKGKKLYEYARKDEKVELPKRKVDIKKIEVLSIEENEIKIKCTVSKGTYIRSLIRDIGVCLGTYATMSELTRTKQGSFPIEESFKLEEIESSNYKILSVEEILKDVKSIELDDKLIKKVENGCPLDLKEKSEFIKFTYEGKVVALYKKDDSLYKMYIKF